jgi:hypothetical protein
VIVKEREGSVVEHDGPPSGLSDVVALDDHLLTSQVAEVLDDDACQLTAGDLDDQLEGIEESFNHPHIEPMRRDVLDMADHLNDAKALATKLIHLASFVIVDAGKES